MALRFTNNNRMSLLQDLMNRNQGLECLNFIGEDGLTTAAILPSELHS